MGNSIMSENSKPQSKVGILGGGQLARMLALKGHELGLHVQILCESPHDPAAQVVPQTTIGKLNDASTLKGFISQVDVVTFESEFLDSELLKSCSEHSRAQVLPSPEMMGLLQDRLTQKNFLIEHKIPTAKFLAASSAEELEQACRFFNFKCVIKKRRFGYDGYGTFVVKNSSHKFDFTELARDPNGFIVEEYIPFQRELAAQFVRSQNGDMITFPLVETLQKDSRCFWVKGPIRHRQFSRIEKLCRTALRKSNYVGVIAFELFERKGELVVNEIAPRVHNSAHHSLDSCHLDQFTAHLLAVTGRRLKSPVLKAPGFAMLNLLGESNNRPSWDIRSPVHLHWYGKHDNRLGRKMGHINSVSTSAEKALKIVLNAKKEFKL